MNSAPEAHQAKAGTPTMGGVVFIFSTIIATILTAKLNNFYIVGGLLTLALFSLIGIKDDLSKILKAKNSAGLSARMKLFFTVYKCWICCSTTILSWTYERFVYTILQISYI